jgi:YfiH family protein
LFEEFQELAHGCFLRHNDETMHPRDLLTVFAQEKLRAAGLYWAKQCHGTDIIDVTPNSVNGQNGDALITAQRGIALMIQYADCQPALFYDPVQHVVAAVHSGWRGSVQNIYRKVIERLQNGYDCKPQNLLVGIGPSLGPCHAEFVNYRTELPPEFWDYQVSPNHFDFWAISREQLCKAGVLPQHIEIANVCTYANPNEYFSYRRDKTTARQAAIILMCHRKLNG